MSKAIPNFIPWLGESPGKEASYWFNLMMHIGLTSFTGALELSALIFLVALLYSSVGHGGASGYLAVLSFTGMLPNTMATTALILNLIVSGLAFQSYYRARHFSFALIWPFLLASIPAAFIGGMLHIPGRSYYLLLGAVLVFAAWRMVFCTRTDSEIKSQPPSLWMALAFGALIGMLSGIVGIGGGIFLSPLLLTFDWADIKQTAAASAFFILANSLSGLCGRFLEGNLVIDGYWYVLPATILGGWLGSHYGARYLPAMWLRRLLAFVLLIAAFKMFIQFH